MKTGLITSNTYQNHNTGDGHPEKIDRVTVIIDNFKRFNNKNLIWKKPKIFKRELLENTHHKDYIGLVEKSFPKTSSSSSFSSPASGPPPGSPPLSDGASPPQAPAALLLLSGSFLSFILEKKERSSLELGEATTHWGPHASHLF